MALRAKYEADFTDFYAAVDRATSSLSDWEKSGAAVESQMDDVASSLGGVSVGGNIQAATKDFESLGATILPFPARLQDVTDSATDVAPAFEVINMSAAEAASVLGQTTGSVDALSTGLQQADKTLGLFGVRIGPQIQALRELGSVSGKTAADIGLIGTAGLAVGAAVAGWKLGRAIADVTGLDETIGNATASILGFGDAAGERHAAKIDVLTRATGIAKRAITDFDEAVRIIQKSNADMAESFNTGSDRVKRWSADIAKVAASGDLVTIERELKNHSSTVQQLAQHYNISADAINYHTRTQAASTAAFKAWADEARPKYEAIRLAQEELNQAGDGWKKTLDGIAPSVRTVATEHIALGQSQTAIATAYSLTNVQMSALNKAYAAQIAELARLEPALGSLDTWLMTAGKQFQVAAESGDQFKTMLELTGGSATQLVPELEKLETTFRSVTTAAREAESTQYTGAQMGTSHGGGQVSLGNITTNPAMDIQDIHKKYAAIYGGNTQLGMVGGGPPKDFIQWMLDNGYATKGAPSFPSGGAVAGAPMNQTINMNGLLGTNDPATRDMIKTMVGDAMAESMRGQRLLSSA